MINGRLTFDEFCDEILRQIALRSSADFDADVASLEASESARGRFPSSWISQAIRELEKRELIRSVDFNERAYLTIDGLREVESASRLKGEDFWSELDDFDGARHDSSLLSEPESSNVVEVQIVSIDHMSDVFQGIEDDIKETIRQVRSQNELMADPDIAQRVAELEAGTTLLKAPRADANLLNRLLLSALTWLLKKVGDEATKALIKKLIEDLPKWIKSLIEASN